MRIRFTYLATASLALVILLGLNSCKKKDRFTITDAEIATEVKDNKNYEKLLAYGQTVGIQTDTTKPDHDIFKFLEEIGYGHKPENIRFIEKILPADTSLIKNAAWELAQGSKIEEVMKGLEPPYPAYASLKKHYTRLSKAGQADSASQIARSLNMYRWMHRQAQGSDRLVLVNTRGA